MIESAGLDSRRGLQVERFRVAERDGNVCWSWHSVQCGAGFLGIVETLGALRGMCMILGVAASRRNFSCGDPRGI